MSVLVCVCVCVFVHLCAMFANALMGVGIRVLVGCG